MMRKIIGFIIFTLLITTTSISVLGTDEKINISNNNYTSNYSELLKPLNQVDEWPMFRHDLNHSGYSTSEAPITSNIKWSYQLDDSIFSSPAVVDGRVYIGCNDYNVYCFDVETGEKIWNFTTGGRVFSSPAIVDGNIYVGSDDNNLYCLNASDGEKIWNFTTNDDIFASPTVADGKVYIGSTHDDDNMYCLNAETGEKIWSYNSGREIVSSSALGYNRVYFGGRLREVYCLNKFNGNFEWWYNEIGWRDSSPVITGGKIILGGSYEDNFNRVICLDAFTGDLIWSYSTGHGVYSSPAVADGKVYIGSNDNNIYCLYADNGSLIWNYTTGGDVQSSPAVADGRVYFGSHDDKVYCLNANTGDKIWSYTTGWIVSCSPAIYDRKLFIGSYDGKLYCFEDKRPYPPEKPEGPTEGYTKKVYEFTTKTDDPEEDQIYYKWDWGDGSISDWFGPYEPGLEVSASHFWNENGTFEIRTKVKNISNEESDWSIPHKINIKNGPFLWIDSIDGGLFFVKVNIKNIGDIKASNVHYHISIDGNFVLLGKDSHGIIDIIPAGEKVEIISRLVIGFGKVKITVLAEIPEGSDEKQKVAYLFLFFIHV